MLPARVTDRTARCKQLGATERHAVPRAEHSAPVRIEQPLVGTVGAHIVRATLIPLAEAGVLLEPLLRGGLELERKHQRGRDGDLRIGKRRDEPTEPVLVDDHVVIGEGDEVSLGLCDAAIPGDGQALARLARVTDPRITDGPAGDKLARALLGPIVDHDDLDALAGDASERGQTTIEGLDSTDRRDDHGNLALNLGRDAAVAVSVGDPAGETLLVGADAGAELLVGERDELAALVTICSSETCKTPSGSP